MMVAGRLRQFGLRGITVLQGIVEEQENATDIVGNVPVSVESAID